MENNQIYKIALLKGNSFKEDINVNFQHNETNYDFYNKSNFFSKLFFYWAFKIIQVFL